MRVVVVSPALPLPFGDAVARWLHVLLAELARRDVDVTCLSSTEAGGELVVAAQRHTAEVDAGFVHVPLRVEPSVVRRRLHSLRRPFSERLRCPGLQAALAREDDRGYDVLHVEDLFNGGLTFRRPRSVLHLHHLDVVDWTGRDDLRLRDRQVLYQMRRATRTVLRRAPRVVVGTDRLAREVARWRAEPVEVVPLGLDVALYHPIPLPAGPVAGLIGSMHWSPSRRAADRLLDLWPAIRAQVPDATLLVAGWNAERYLGSRFPLDGAELVGEVAEPADFFRRIGVLIYPTPRGSGVKVKVLEAMAYGRPVVSTAEGLEGLGPAARAGALAAETDEEVVAASVRLLRDASLRSRLGTDGRRAVEGGFSPGPTVDRLLDAWARVGLGASSPRRG